VSTTPTAAVAAGTPAAQPTWHRALEIGAGFLAIILAGIALADPGLGLFLLAFLFALALLWIGVWRLTRAYVRPEQPGWHRTLDAVLGVGAIVISFVVIALPGLGILALVLLLYVGLVLIGLTWLGAATKGAEPGWYRGLAAALGVFSIIAAVVALIDVTVAVLTLVLLLALVLLLIGAGDLIAGFSGRPYRPLIQLPEILRPPIPPAAPPTAP
jgi:uncharacterized membrane protein HdeD (DUF308 family)